MNFEVNVDFEENKPIEADFELEVPGIGSYNTVKDKPTLNGVTLIGDLQTKDLLIDLKDCDNTQTNFQSLEQIQELLNNLDIPTVEFIKELIEEKCGSNSTSNDNVQLYDDTKIRKLIEDLQSELDLTAQDLTNKIADIAEDLIDEENNRTHNDTYINAGTIFSIPRDFQTLTDFFSFLNNKWSDGTITCLCEQNLGYGEAYSQEKIIFSNINIPSIIIDGQGTTCKNKSLIFQPTEDIDDLYFDNKLQNINIVIRGFNFLNKYSEYSLVFEGSSYNVLINKCKFNVRKAIKVSRINKVELLENEVEYLVSDEDSKNDMIIVELSDLVKSIKNKYISTTTDNLKNNMLACICTELESFYDCFDLTNDKNTCYSVRDGSNARVYKCEILNEDSYKIYNSK